MSDITGLESKDTSRDFSVRMYSGVGHVIKCISPLDSTETSTFYQNDLAIRNTTDVTGELITVRLQSISGVSAVNLLVAFYDIHGRKGEVLFICHGYHTRPW
jgi:hypothetical protein